MVKPFRFALQGANFADRDELIDMAREAESLGYEELYSYDHIGSVDPFVPLLIAAEATTRWPGSRNTRPIASCSACV
jgi:alkanesulfonate monooxygenase SsuD/methylene tetrahydromethanopterin reductase-like flavin-dependent oxidoreductase (luciferase family)